MLLSPGLYTIRCRGPPRIWKVEKLPRFSRLPGGWRKQVNCVDDNPGGWQFNAQTIKLCLFRLFGHYKKDCSDGAFSIPFIRTGASSIKLLTQNGLVLMSARLEEGS